jgi:hypothetical protein
VNPSEQPKVESEDISDFVRIMACEQSSSVADERLPTGRINIDPEKVKNGLAQLVLTLIKLLHELLERQAIRRIDAGGLSDLEIEKLGVTFMRQAEEIERFRELFGFEESDLNLDLGPLGKLR